MFDNILDIGKCECIVLLQKMVFPLAYLYLENTDPVVIDV